jgi:hypothetical protein
MEKLRKEGRMSRTKPIVSIHNSNQLSHQTRVVACAICLLVLTNWLNLGAAASDPRRYQGGLRNSPGQQKLDAKKLQRVLKSLQEKTGWIQMDFDEQGFLTIGDRTKFSGGSAAARALVAGAVASNHAIDLESYDRSPLVAFARLATPTVYHSYLTDDSINVYPIQVDFSDFSKLRGDSRAVSAFDVGFVILHELGHAVLGLRDATDGEGEPGECESYINQIRRELNLPERQNYLARVSSITPIMSQKTTQHAELFFAKSAENQSGSKPTRFILSWEAQTVGPIRPPAAPITAKVRNAKPVTASVNGQ